MTNKPYIHEAVAFIFILFSLAIPTFGEETKSSDESLHESTIYGEIRDAETENPLDGATVLLIVQVQESNVLAGVVKEVETDRKGRYSIIGVESGIYSLRFIKAGYRPATLKDIILENGNNLKWDFPLVRIPEEPGSEIYNLQEFVVSAEQLTDDEYAFEALRKESILSVDLLTGADLSKFAASDVAEAIKRIPGVSVQEGKFAVIRGLNERYSSTLFNGAPIPSPDPDKQSVPLDLFPSDTISNLVVKKSFSPDLPGNSSGGSINILTDVFPEGFRLIIKSGIGFNSNAVNQFFTDGGRPDISLDFQNLGSLENRTIVTEQITNGSYPVSPVEKNPSPDYKFKVDLGGMSAPFIFGRQLEYRLSVSKNHESNSRIGTIEDQYARESRRNLIIPTKDIIRINESGDLALRQLSISRGTFDNVESSAIDEYTGLLDLKIHLDKDRNQSIGYTGFYINTESEDAVLRDNGTLSLEDEKLLIFQGGGYYELNSILNLDFEDFKKITYWESSIVDEERDLLINQLRGEHRFYHILDGLNVSWNLTQSEANQLENNAISANGFKLESGTYVIGQSSDLGDSFRVTASWRDIKETQDIVSLGLELEKAFSAQIEMTLSGGVFYDDSKRDVRQDFYQYFLQSISEIDPAVPASPSISTAVRDYINKNALVTPLSAESSGHRKIQAQYISVGLKLFEKFKVSFGYRFEEILMTTETSSGKSFLNSEILRLPPNGTLLTRAVENSQILGYDGPLSADYVGKIDENHALPSLLLSYQINTKNSLRASISQTIVRPSFKEFTFITVRNPTSLDWESGNPLLSTSKVDSYDIRYERLFGEGSDLFAVSFFAKEVANPIERTTLRGTFQTEFYFNNPNDASIRGVEVEINKDLAFIDFPILRDLSVGANFTYIDATIDVPENFRKLFSGGLLLDNGNVLGGGFYALKTDKPEGEFLEPIKSRPLFDQPEWIFNTNLAYENEVTDTSIILSLYAQGPVLYSAAGYIGTERAVIPDRYIGTYHELNLVIQQKVFERFTVSLGIKNLTNALREVYYSEEMIAGAPINESYRNGREYSLAVSAEF